MAITINNGLANIDGTPGAASGVFSNRPSASNVANGTLYFATDTAAIYQVVAGLWVNYASGGGGTPGIDDVLAVGQSFQNNHNIDVNNFEFSIENIKVFTLQDTSLATQLLFFQNQIQLFSNFLGFETDSGDTVTIGDLSGASLTIELDKPNDRISIIRQSVYNGLDINFTAGFYKIGDFDGLANNNSIQIEDIGRRIFTTDLGSLTGLDLSFLSNTYRIGDLNSNNNLTINATTGDTLLLAANNITLYQGSSGLILNSGISKLCDPDGNGHSSFFGLDDNAEKLIGSTNLLATTGTPTSDRIKIELNGTLYYIVLEK